jgi:hypothetical protein
MGVAAQQAFCITALPLIRRESVGSKRQILKWDGAKWADGRTVGAPHRSCNVGPFIMQPEGMGRLFAIDKMAEGPFPNTTSRLNAAGN